MSNNAYPEKPEIPYERTTVSMSGADGVIAYLQGTSALTNVKRMAYFMFRNESANGQSGVNNNYIGAQADGARWPAKWDASIIGTVTEPENGTGRTRIFLAFDRWQTSVDILVDEVFSRGLFIDGATIVTEDDLVGDYYREWVTGDPHAIAPQATVDEFRSIYGQAMALFRNGAPLASDPARSDPPRAPESDADKLMDAELDQINKDQPT